MVLEDLFSLLPELALVATGVLVMVADPVLARPRKPLTGWIALAGTLVALGLVPLLWDSQGESFNRLIIVDGFGIFVRGLLLVIATLTILSAFRYLEREGLLQGEFYALVLFGTAALGVMVAANELMLVFLALETSSLASYILIGFRRTELKSNEASMKYFLLGSFATAFFLYGVALIFGTTGTTVIPDLAAKLATPDGRATWALMAMAMLFVGLAFKVATAPFQVWTPDVYEGAPTPVTAFLAAAPKAATFAVFLRVFLIGLEPAQGTWFWILWGSAALTMFVGNLGALVQTNIKRMLAYSSIAHAGYTLVAFAAGSELGVAAVLFYLVAYALMKLGAFSLVSHISAGETNQSIDDYAGLYARQPFLAACMAVFMFSLIGFPLTAGFLGKFYIIEAALRARLTWLAVLVVVNSLLSAPYYLRVIKVMYLDKPPEGAAVAPVPASLAFVLTVTSVGLLLLFVYPDAVRFYVESSILSASRP